MNQRESRNLNQVLTYLIVGTLIGVGFIAISLILIFFFNFSQDWAVFLSYLATLPLSFFFQKKITFKSDGDWIRQGFCFMLVTGFIFLYYHFLQSNVSELNEPLFYLFANWLFISAINFIFYKRLFK